MNEIERTACAAANRVDEATFGMDPVTIAAIITQVLPLVIDCFSRNDASNPDDVREAVARMNERDPKSLRKRLARRIRGESDENLSKNQSFTLADAVIAETLDSTPDHVSHVFGSMKT